MSTHRSWAILSSTVVPIGVGLWMLSTSSCAPQPSHAKSAADRAAFIEQTRCGEDDDDKALAPVLEGRAVVAVEPLYTRRSGQQTELRGATVNVSALAGVTAEWLDRALECHGAKAMLGHGQKPTDDPFWLPDAAIDIDVRSAKDGFDVAVTGFSPDEARRILARANGFAAAKVAPVSK